MSKYRKIILVLLLIVLSAIPSYENGSKLKIGGKEGFPYFNNKGELKILYIDSKNILSSAEIHQNKILPINLYLKKNIYFPKAKRDKKNNVWIIWEEKNLNERDIFIALLKRNKLYRIKNISKNFNGFNFSPDMDFSFNNEKWITWVNYNEGKFNLIVKNLNKNLTWNINLFGTSSVLDPRILIDGENKVWVFWVGQYNGIDNIFYTFLKNGKWRESQTINNNVKAPSLTPSVSLNFEGFPVVVWSSYDGSDYEIYYSEWDGEKWLSEEVTQNDEISDFSPSVVNYLGYIPLIAWTRSTRNGSDIYIKFKTFKGWSEEVNISNDKEPSRYPFIVSFENKIVVLWQSHRDIRILYLVFPPLTSEANFKNWRFLPSVFQQLQDNKYIAFGDSITYGYINEQPAPEKGYVPRLENLLDYNFQDSEVINRGVPGETTIEGLGRIEATIYSDSAFYLLLMEGTNDIIHNKISVETSKFNLEEMVKKCLEFNMFPLIATIIPRNDIFWELLFYRDRIFKLNEYIRQIAGDYSILLADQFKTFYEYPEEYGGWKSLLSDRNHPNEKGYQLMAETWFSKIKAIPFPPVKIKVKREINEILFFKEILNTITWEPNPKVSSETKLEKYLIYRKKQSDEYFKLIAEVNSSTFRYFDKDISSDFHYIYAIQAVNSDGLKGPLSNPVNEE